MTKSTEETRYYAKYSAATGEFYAVPVRWKEAFNVGVVTVPAGWYDEYARAYTGKTYSTEYGAIKAARSSRRGGR